MKLLVFVFLLNLTLGILGDIDVEGNELGEGQEDRPKADRNSLMLNRDTFLVVINEPDIGSLIMYYAPWCGHCKRMFNTWNLLSQRHNANKKFIIAKVDCTSETELCSDHDILGYPT